MTDLFLALLYTCRENVFTHRYWYRHVLLYVNIKQCFHLGIDYILDYFTNICTCISSSFQIKTLVFQNDCEVLCLDSGIDYRMSTLPQDGLYFL